MKICDYRYSCDLCDKKILKEQLSVVYIIQFKKDIDDIGFPTLKKSRCSFEVCLICAEKLKKMLNGHLKVRGCVEHIESF